MTQTNIIETEDEAVELTPEQQLRKELNALPIEELQRRTIELALTYGGNAEVIGDEPAKALEYLNASRERVSEGHRDPNLKRRPYWEKTAQDHPEDWALYRAAMRVHALSSQLLGENNGTFAGEFYGSGDSGNYEVDTGDTLVDNFLEKMLDRHVNFDWYNNDGGYGDITWEVANDVITINGSQYVTESVSVMDEEEF